ncbi:hypothetical protein BJX63DRAFT_353540 [Aspergillus granulosus]|uniref:Secreted protein n=1 Tax=Aspergillus granulosus TaxID=176169 RepID=A0ABR4H252_9EURO
MCFRLFSFFLKLAYSIAKRLDLLVLLVDVLLKYKVSNFLPRFSYVQREWRVVVEGDVNGHFPVIKPETATMRTWSSRVLRRRHTRRYRGSP